MDIKIVCDCGQKYIFEVDPENGQMPAAVTCPACGADGTKEANDIMGQIFPDQPAEPSAEPPVESPAEPVAEAVPPLPAALSAGPLRMSAPVRLAVAASPPPSLPASTPPPLPADHPVSQPIRPLAATPKAKAAAEYSLGLGILGAVLGAGLGAGLMYVFFEWAGFRFPLMGTGIGALAGLGARTLARGTDMTLGVIAGVVALMATAGTLYLMFGDVAGAFIFSMIVSVSFAYKIAG